MIEIAFKQRSSLFFFIGAALLVFFFRAERLQQHDGGRPALRALNAPESVNELLQSILTSWIWRKQARGPICDFNWNFERTRNRYQCMRLRLALAIQKLVNDCPVQISGTRTIGLGPPASIDL
jgi:hypothetical protein